MLDRDTLRRAFDAQVRLVDVADLRPGVEAQVDGTIVRMVGEYRGFVSGPADLGVTGSALEELITRQRDFFAARGEAVEWKTWGHDLPRELPTLLEKAGFVPEPVETVVVADAATTAAHGEPPLPGDVAIRATASRRDIERIAAMEAEVWGEDHSSFVDELFERAERGGIVVLLAESGNTVVSAGWLSTTPGCDFAGLWGGSTLKEWRGRGLYRTLVARRARLAVERGARYLYVDASDDSRPILERLGFVAVTTTTPYVWTPPAG